jgi:hypothetical protein
MTLNQRLDTLRAVASEDAIAADSRSRERLAILRAANFVAEQQGRALTLEHLVALEIVSGARGVNGEARDQAEHDNRLRQWRQLLDRHRQALATGATHPDRVSNAERQLTERGLHRAASDLFDILLSHGQIRPFEYGALLESILSKGLQAVMDDWKNRPPVVSFATVGR